MIVAVVTYNAQHVAWFSDVHHADAFADLLRAGGAWGVEVIERGGMPTDAATCDGCDEPATRCPDCADAETCAAPECDEPATHCAEHAAPTAEALARVRAALVAADATIDSVQEALDGA